MSGVIDQGSWGICGFVSVLNALAQDGRLMQFYNVSMQQMQQRLGPELVGYLRMRSVDRPDIIERILTFTKSFGTQYDYGNVGNLISKIENSVRAGTVTTAGSIGVALPPEALADYFQTVFNLPAKVTSYMYVKSGSLSELNTLKGCVVGLGGPDRTQPFFNLRHWVYVNKAGILYNWNAKTDLSRGSAALVSPTLTHIVYTVQV